MFGRLVAIFVIILSVGVGETYGDHSDSDWHLLDSDTSMELCKRVLHEGRVIGMLSNENGGYETILYFGGSLYRAEYHFGLRSISCRAYRVSPTTRQLPKPG